MVVSYRGEILKRNAGLSNELIGDGVTIREGTDFAVGATYTINPTVTLPRSLKVLGSVANSDNLTANMTVSLNQASPNWGDRIGLLAAIQIEKGGPDTFSVIVSGLNENGSGTKTLIVQDQWLLAIRISGIAGQGPNGEYFIGIGGGPGSQTAVRALLAKNATNHTPLANDRIPVYSNGNIFQGTSLVSSLPTGGEAIARTFAGTITPDTKEVSYATFSQSGAQSFTKGAGTVDGSFHHLPFNSNGAALTWNAGFRAGSGSLPTSLTTGLWDIMFRYHEARDEFLVSWAKLSGSDLIGETLSDIVLKDYAETAVSQTGVTGTLTIDFAVAPYHHITHGAGNITAFVVNNWPNVGSPSTTVFGSVTVDLKQDGVGGRTMVLPTNGVWVGGTPTLDTAANKTNRITLTTRDGGSSVQAHYAGAY